MSWLQSQFSKNGPQANAAQAANQNQKSNPFEMPGKDNGIMSVMSFSKLADTTSAMPGQFTTQAPLGSAYQTPGDGFQQQYSGLPQTGNLGYLQELNRQTTYASQLAKESIADAQKAQASKAAETPTGTATPDGSAYIPNGTDLAPASTGTSSAGLEKFQYNNEGAPVAPSATEEPMSAEEAKEKEWVNPDTGETVAFDELGKSQQDAILKKIEKGS